MKEENGAFTYVEKEDGTIKISRLTNISLKIVEVPQQIDGSPVTEIEPFAFRGCSCLTSVIIPGSVTKIGEFPLPGSKTLTTITVHAGSYAEE